MHISDVGHAVSFTDVDSVCNCGHNSGKHSGASVGIGKAVFRSVSHGTGGDVDGEVLSNLVERGVNGLGQHVGVGLVGVVVTLLESVRVDTGGLGLGEAEGSLNGAPFVGLVQVLECEVVARRQERCLVVVSQVLVEEGNTL